MTTGDLTRPIVGIENRTAAEVFDIMCDRIRHAHAREAGAQEPAPPPASLKLVPVKPTPEMVDVGEKARWRSAIRDANNVREIYAAMLAAAPVSPPAESGERFMSDKTRQFVEPVRKMLAEGINVQALGYATNQIVEGAFRSLVGHIDELEMDLAALRAAVALASTSAPPPGSEPKGCPTPGACSCPQLGDTPSTVEPLRDWIDPFEKKWAAYRHANREPANYGVKQTIAWDFFSMGLCADPQPSGAVKVKALEFPPRCPRGQRVHSRPQALIRYTIAHHGGDVGSTVYQWASEGGNWSEPHHTYEAAIGCAQADYEQRILSALSPSPSGWDAGAEDWRDIASAPKDGTRFWALNPQMKAPVIVEWKDYVGFSGLPNKEWVCVSDPYERWQPMIGSMVCPTIWHHLLPAHSTSTWTTAAKAMRELCAEAAGPKGKQTAMTAGTAVMHVGDGRSPGLSAAYPSPPRRQGRADDA